MMSQQTFSFGDAESTRSAADSRGTLSQKVSRLLRRTPPIVKGEWIIMCEFAVVIALVVIVWGLLSLPIVFFYTGPDSDTATGTDSQVCWETCTMYNIAENDLALNAMQC